MSAFRESALSRTLFLRLRENRWTEPLERVLRDAPPGGVLLAEPLPRSLGGALDFIGRIRRACAGSIFIAIREEGGPCDPLSRYLPALPSPRAAALKGRKAVGRLGDLTGEGLRLLGFNTNFAPTLDLATPLSEKMLTTRAFGSDPHHVGECGRAFARRLTRHKILACGKHFPGWGSVPFEKGSDLPVSAKPMAALWSEDLIPFRRLLPKLPMVLVSTAAYKAYDFDQPRPACLSSFVIDGLLREKLGYRGLAIGFDLEQESVHGTLGFSEAVVQALNAGCDMVVVDQGAPFSSALKALENGAQSGRLSSRRVEKTLARIGVTQKRIQGRGGKFSAKALAKICEDIEEFSKEVARRESDHA